MKIWGKWKSSNCNPRDNSNWNIRRFWFYCDCKRWGVW